MTGRDTDLFCVRPVQEDDLPALFQLATKAGVGMTSMPQNKEELLLKIKESQESFAKSVKTPGNEHYLFVLEEVEKQQVVGCAGIEANTGVSQPFYSFKLSTHKIINQELAIEKDIDTLLLVTDKQGASEVCSLILLPEYRKSGLGQFLSRVRFLWMANNKERLCESVIAEMRGVADKKGESPFWNYLGRLFIDLPFAKADQLVAEGKKQFISDLMPRSPIFVPLLPKVSQKVIGQVRRSTLPALKLLKKEGFRFQHYIDIFDAGPTMEVPLEAILTVRKSKLAPLTKIVSHLGPPYYMIGNVKQAYRATLAPLREEDGGVKITTKIAKLLDVKEGEPLRYMPFPFKK